jgi:hypothetical protein
LTGYDQNTSPFQHHPYDNSLLLLSTSPKESKSGVSCRMSDFGHTQEKDKILHQSLGQTHIYIFALLCKLWLTVNRWTSLQIRETPHKRHHKFIEYYDVRAAEAALKSLNRCDIAGKRIKLEPSRPGGARRKCVRL